MVHNCQSSPSCSSCCSCRSCSVPNAGFSTKSSAPCSTEFNWPPASVSSSLNSFSSSSPSFVRFAFHFFKVVSLVNCSSFSSSLFFFLFPQQSKQKQQQPPSKNPTPTKIAKTGEAVDSTSILVRVEPPTGLSADSSSGFSRSPSTVVSLSFVGL